MSNVLLVDKDNNIGGYLISVNTPDFKNGTNLINPDLTAVSGIPQKYWKVKNGKVIEMTTMEKDAYEAPIFAEQQKITNLRVSLNAKLIELGLTQEEINLIRRL